MEKNHLLASLCRTTRRTLSVVVGVGAKFLLKNRACSNTLPVFEHLQIVKFSAKLEQV